MVEANPKPIALFVVGNTAQADMFKAITEALPEWDTVAINMNKCGNRTEIERHLKVLNFNYETIAGLSYRKVKKTLIKKRPAIVIVGNDRPSMDRLFIKCANSMQIPTLLVQDGILMPNTTKPNMRVDFCTHFIIRERLILRFLKFMARKDLSWQCKLEIILHEMRYNLGVEPIVCGHGDCSKMAVFGEATKSKFISEGIPPEYLVVTGNPKFDNIYRYKGLNCKQDVCEKFGITCNKKIILLITQYFVEIGAWRPEQRTYFISAINRAIATLPNTQLIIKISYPHENKSTYRELIKGLTPSPILCQNISLPLLINASDLIITVSSTTALEAMAMAKPVMIVNLFNNSSPSFYKDSGALFVEDADLILPLITRVLNDPNILAKMLKPMNTFVTKQAYLQDGQASKRIAHLIRNMVAKKDHT